MRKPASVRSEVRVSKSNLPFVSYQLSFWGLGLSEQYGLHIFSGASIKTKQAQGQERLSKK
jgi:hypothetical protein